MLSIDPQTAAWYAAQKHSAQKYGQQPYTVHLEMALHELETHILPLSGMRFYHHDIIRCAVWLHDVVEDTGTSIFELGTLFDPRVVELVDAVTDGPGKNRAERKAPMYVKVLNIGLPAIAVKLADRMANAKACSLSKDTNRMLEMYRKEQPGFEARVRVNFELQPAWETLRGYLGLATH
jgi:(p)ppGpp synthase/HD superfamily hydrolase